MLPAGVTLVTIARDHALYAGVTLVTVARGHALYDRGQSSEREIWRNVEIGVIGH